MARVTVEDCVDKIPNRYELLMVAAQRAKDIAAGAPLMVERDNDKNPVVALREIAEDKVNIHDLQRSLVVGLQKFVEVEEPEEEELEIIAAERELSKMDDQFDNLLLDSEASDSMQIQDEETDLDLDSESDIDLDSDLDDADLDEDFDDDIVADDDVSGSFDDFDE